VEERSPADTRARILAAALDLFVAYGYQRTTLRQIAERLGISKTAILYHFPAKDRIMAALAEPMVDDLESAVDRAARLPPAAARWALVEGWLDVFLTHQRAMLMARHDLAMLAQQPIYQKIMRIPVRGAEIIAGPGATLAERVRAMQALGIIGDPVMFFPDTPREQLRELILDGVRRLLGEDEPTGGVRPADRHGGGSAGAPDAAAGPAALDAAAGPAAPEATGTGRAGAERRPNATQGTGAVQRMTGAEQATGGAERARGDAERATGWAERATGGAERATGGAGRATGGAGRATGGAAVASGGGRRRAGRPRSLGSEELAAARRMYEAGTHTVDEIAGALGVSRATLYRHLNGAGAGAGG